MSSSFRCERAFARDARAQRAADSAEPSSRRFEQLDRVAVRIFNRNLAFAGTGLHLVSKAEAGALERGDTALEIRDAQHDAVPAAGLLTFTVRHRTRARCSGAAQQNVRIAERHTGERGKLLMVQRETELLGVEVHRAGDVLHVVADAVETLDERACVYGRGGGVRHGDSLWRMRFGGNPSIRAMQERYHVASDAYALLHKVICVKYRSMRILRAAHLGMCFGVRDAIALALEHSDAGPLTILGDLVHNPTVLSALEAKG